MERADIKFYYRTISDIRNNIDLGFEDPNGILESMTVKVKETLLANPSLKSDDDICQIIALDGIKVIGSELSFPNKFVVNGNIMECRGASTLFVDEAYRKYAVGTDLMINAATIVPKQDNIVGGISQMAYPIYKAMRYVCFPFNRFIYLRKSRAVVEYVLKKNTFLSVFISKVLDFMLFFYRWIAFGGNRWRMKKYFVETVHTVPQEVEDMVLKDEHSFKEYHDRKWFEWNLNYSFRIGGEKAKSLSVIKNKNQEIVGFFLIKIEHYKQASLRGFKNVTLGTVSEWGIKNGVNLSEFDIQMAAIRSMPSTIDGAEVATTDSNTVKRFKIHLLFPMGYANMAALIQSSKDNAVKDIKNWRVRIATGDTLLN